MVRLASRIISPNGPMAYTLAMASDQISGAPGTASKAGVMTVPTDSVGVGWVGAGESRTLIGRRGETSEQLQLLALFGSRHRVGESPSGLVPGPGRVTT